VFNIYIQLSILNDANSQHEITIENQWDKIKELEEKVDKLEQELERSQYQVSQLTLKIDTFEGITIKQIKEKTKGTGKWKHQKIGTNIGGLSDQYTVSDSVSIL